MELIGANKFLTMDNVSLSLQQMKLIRSPLRAAANKLGAELQEGDQKPFQDIYYGDLGDSHALGQKPITFIRQVASLCLDLSSINDSKYPEDVKARAMELLRDSGGQSIGSYSEEMGMTVVRKHVAEYIMKRDGGVPSDWTDIICSSGASSAIKDVLSLFKTDEGAPKAGILVPNPQYPLYGSLIKAGGQHMIEYDLDEEDNWSLNIAELENVLNTAKVHCEPRVLVVINPGNPTGQVLTRSCIEDIIKLAYREKLFILADEVYQQNVYLESAPFHSFKKVLVEMGHPYSSMELASFMSISKGYAGECGLRGGYVELFNLCPKIRHLAEVIMQMHLCPSALGQVVLDCIAKEPAPGDESFLLFQTEKTNILNSLKRKAKNASQVLGSFYRVICNPIAGAMYTFPRLDLPEKAIKAAAEERMLPDSFYARELLKATGICTSPGNMYGQRKGTYHVRITILGHEEAWAKCLDKFKRFNDSFMKKYE